MIDIREKLAILNDPDQTCKNDLLVDLAELLARNNFTGEAASFSFYDPDFDSLPKALPKEMIRLFVGSAGKILLSQHEPENLRTTAAWVLGKTYLFEALLVIADAISQPGPLPHTVARQCAFSFDALVNSCESKLTQAQLLKMAQQFQRHGIPWNSEQQRPDVENL